MAACPCWGDRGTVPGPMLTEDTCARRDTAAERPAAAPTTTNSGVSWLYSCGSTVVLWFPVSLVNKSSDSHLGLFGICYDLMQQYVP